jgi:uncharacterized protein (TIGR00369 family)
MPTDVFDRFPMPPWAATLGWRLIDAAPERGWIKVGFEGKPDFCNPAGFIQGGFLAAMLDEVMGPAILSASEGALYTATASMNVSFLAPARVGALTGEGRVVQLGRTIGFVEASLFHAAGVEVARASATARLVPTEKLAANANPSG